MSRSRVFILWAGLVLTLALAASLFQCGAETQEAQPQKTNSTLSLTSSSLSGETIPSKFTCDGEETSPELSWTSPPAGTQSFALIVTDKDSSFVHFVHWVVYDLPADKRELPEGIPKQDQLPDGSRQGKTDFDKVGYGGPCPHWKSTHHYGFVLYALDSKLGLPGGATAKQTMKAMNGHILAKAELVGSYHR